MSAIEDMHATLNQIEECIKKLAALDEPVQTELSEMGAKYMRMYKHIEASTPDELQQLGDAMDDATSNWFWAGFLVNLMDFCEDSYDAYLNEAEMSEASDGYREAMELL